MKQELIHHDTALQKSITEQLKKILPILIGDDFQKVVDFLTDMPIHQGDSGDMLDFLVGQVEAHDMKVPVYCCRIVVGFVCSLCVFPILVYLTGAC